MFSVIIPTMWNFEPFPKFLEDVLNHPSVGEVILFNNAVEKTPNHPALQHSKLTVVSPKENLGVNYPWNIGCKMSQYDYLCILNDDLIFDLRLFEKVKPVLGRSDTGMVGLHAGLEEFEQIPFTNGLIDILEWQGVHTFSFGCLMFVQKDHYLTIPSDLKYYYGDEWLFDMSTAIKRRNYIITNMFFYTPYAATSSKMPKINLERETEIYYEKYKPVVSHVEQVYNYLMDEYNKSINTPSDINEHLEILREYALRCQHVTELGVREGESTKAFLSAPVILRSYDLYKSNYVEHLFDVARSASKDVKYFIADATGIDIEETDLLFIDTYHLYDQLTIELARHGNNARKYIIFHDTKNAQSELAPAILEFMAVNPHWQIELNKINNNGLLVLKRNG